jgi:Bacterial lipid A biosynthesis acyltransferase
MRTARKIRYRLEWLGLKFATKFLPLLSRKACYRLALLLGSLGASLDRRGRRVALSNLRVAFGDEISSERRAQIVHESDDRHLLHGRVSQKRAFDFDGRNIFTATYDDVFQPCRELT